MSKEPKTYLNPKPEKGYAKNPELEASVRAKRDDASAYLVYADWLSQQGDPRGELIVLQHKLSTPGQGGEGAAISAREAELLAQNGHFLGGLIPHGSGRYPGRLGDGVVTVTWRWGFFDSMRLFNTTDWMDSKFPTQAVCERAFELPAAACLRELKVGVLRWEYQTQDVKTVIDEAAKAPFAKDLSIFRLGDVNGIDIDCGHHTIGDVSGISKAFPKLSELTIWGCEIALGAELLLPELRTLKVQTCGMSKANVDAIVNGKLANLETLELWFGSEDYGGECSADDLAAILDGSSFPKLKHLGLMNAEMTNDLCASLGDAKILPRLESLDLSMGTMTDEGARSLLQHRSALKHLKRINVSDNFLSADVITELKAIGPEIVSTDQKDNEDDYRYVTVAE